MINHSKKRLNSIANLVVIVIFGVSFFWGIPMFIFEPDKDLWFSTARSDDSMFNRARINVLLWRGADLTFTYASSSTLDLALQEKDKWLLEKFADYATEEERRYAVDFAVNTGDEAFIAFVRETFTGSREVTDKP